MIRRGLFGVVVLASLACGGFQVAQAQDWTQVTLDTSVVRTPYFLDTSIGFAFNAGIVDESGLNLTYSAGRLEKTTDGGITWQYLPFFDSIGCSITQICFVSLQHGYIATTYGWNFVNSGIYETTDQGNNWKKISPAGLAFTGVYVANGTIFASEATTANIANGAYYYGLTGEILYSRDEGATWDSITQVSGITNNRTPQFQFIYGNRDSLVATVYFDDSSYANGGENTYLVFSTNLGQSWQSSFLDSSYIFPIVTLHISPHTCNIIRQHMDSEDREIDYFNYSFLESLPPYTDWDSTLMQLPTFAWIAGNSCAMYLSEGVKEFPYLSPFRRSTNNGLSWVPIDTGQDSGDEFDADDNYNWQNLSVVGYGAVVFAATDESELIKTTDGGDGTLSVSALAPRLEIGRGVFASGTDTLVMTECSPSSMFIYYQNLACAITTLDSLSVSGLDPSEYSFTSTDHSNCSSLPDTAFVSLTPHDTGTYQITVTTHFVDDEYNTIDIPTSFTLVVNPGTQPVTLSLGITPANITTAPSDTLEIPVYLSGNATLDSTFITLPFGMDTNLLRPIAFHSALEITADSQTFSNGMEIVPLRTAGLTLNGKTQIGSFRCIVYLGDTLATTISFSNATLTSINAPCVGLSLIADSVHITISACGDETLLHFMKTDSISITILTIAPNPAMDVLQISLMHPSSSAISYQVVDALGETRLSGVTAADALSLDVSSLPQGVYFFRATSMDGMQSGKQFVIMR
jgi:hypothetical protein